MRCNGRGLKNCKQLYFIKEYCKVDGNHPKMLGREGDDGRRKMKWEFQQVKVGCDVIVFFKCRLCHSLQ